MDGQSNSPDDSNVFVLYPVMIPGWVTPVQPAGIADGGIPKRIYDEVPEGLECLIDPWTEFRTRGIEPLALNDRVDLYIDSWPAAVAGKTIQPADVDQRIALHIPKDRLREGVNEIYYKVTRPSENSSRDSRKLKVLYHRFTPGEPDHSQRTVQLPPEVVSKGIDKAMAVRGVVVGFDYRHIRAYDLIRLNVGRTYIDRRVEPNEASPITMTLYTPTFEAAGDNDKTPFEYLVIDQLSNASVLSAPTYIDVHLARLDLKAPILLAPATNPIDLLESTPVIVRVGFDTAQKGDKAQLIESNPLPGSVPFPQLEFNTNNRARFTLSPEFLRARHGTAFELRWQLFRDGKSIGESEPLQLEVKQIAEFLKPSIKEANGSTLNPVAAKDALTAVLPANKVLLATDRVIFKWIGAPGTPADGSHTSVPRELGQNFEFPIPNSVVAFNLGLSVTVSYTITRGNGDPIPSQTFTLAVQTMPQDALPKPIIEQAANNGEGTELNVANLTANAIYRMGTWPLIDTGQFVWLSLHGTNINDTPYRKVIHQAPGSYVNPQWMTQKFYTRSIALSELKNLKDGSTLTMEFKASFSKDEKKQVDFPLRTYTIKSIVLLQPVITSIKNGSTEVGNGTILNVIGGTETSVTVTGAATENSTIELFDNGVSKGMVSVGANKVWSTLVKVAVGLHRFTATAKYGNNPVSTPWTFNQKALWNFVNGSFQGWRAEGNYQGTLDNNHGGVGSNTSTPQDIWRGMIMYCPIQVEAGKKYKFTYQLRFVRTGNSNVNGTTVTLNVGAAAIGSAIGVNYNIIGPVSGSGQYTAPATGSVMLNFYNHVANHYGNDFRFNNITMEEAAAVRGFDAPESPEDIVKRMEDERLERLKAFEGLTNAERLKKLEGFVEPEMLEKLKGLNELERLKALEELAGIAPFDKGKALEELKQQLAV